MFLAKNGGGLNPFTGIQDPELIASLLGLLPSKPPLILSPSFPLNKTQNVVVVYKQSPRPSSKAKALRQSIPNPSRQDHGALIIAAILTSTPNMTTSPVTAPKSASSVPTFGTCNSSNRDSGSTR